jgi:hypothetical protein
MDVVSLLYGVLLGLGLCSIKSFKDGHVILQNSIFCQILLVSLHVH